MNDKMDPMGRAIADYWKTKKADRLRVFSPMFEEDEIPLTTLFRKYKAMPEIERKTLDMVTGKTLDVGAGSGCHSLVLQEKGIDVTAIDISPLSVETMKERGVKKVMEQDFFTMQGKYHLFHTSQFQVQLMLFVVLDHDYHFYLHFHTKIYYAVYCVEQRVLHYFYLFLSYETREERALAGGQVQTGILGN